MHPQITGLGKVTPALLTGGTQWGGDRIALWRQAISHPGYWLQERSLLQEALYLLFLPLDTSVEKSTLKLLPDPPNLLLLFPPLVKLELNSLLTCSLLLARLLVPSHFMGSPLRPTTALPSLLHS